MNALLVHLLAALPTTSADARPEKPPMSVSSNAPNVEPWRLAIASTSAFGVTHARFFNQLVGARIDYRLSSRFACGAGLAYANLKGKDGRVDNALPELSTEYRTPLVSDRLGLPIRVAWGFLPKNGPSLRVGLGVDIALSQRISLELVPLEPMVWLNRDRPEVSFDASLAVRVAL